MPEGDTNYRAARALEKALGGKVVTAFETGLAKLTRVNDDTPLVGRTSRKWKLGASGASFPFRET